MAGVSKQTVSRVVNGSQDVSAQTRETVVRAIGALGYRPNPVARQLTSGRSYSLGVVGSDVSYLSTRAHFGSASRAEALGYSLVIKNLPVSDVAAVSQMILALQDLQVDGVLWVIPEVGASHAWIDAGLLASLRVPVVFMNIKPRPGIHVVGFDHREAGRRATRHLIARGRRHIAHISGPAGWWAAEQRREGWLDALDEAGLALPGPVCVAADWRAASGYAAMAALLAQHAVIDGIFASNDSIALGAMARAREQGVEIPRDVAIIGVDNQPDSEFYCPSLTTLEQDMMALGEHALDTLAAEVDAHFGKHRTEAPASSMLYQHTLIVRRSCGG